MTKHLSTEVLIIGAGTAGMYALSEVRRAKKDFLMIDRGPLGTTCARVGCMPSKVILQSAHDWATQQHFTTQGINLAGNSVLDSATTMNYLRTLRDGFAGGTAQNTERVTGERLIMGEAKFISPTQVEVTTSDGLVTIDAEKVIIASGSHPVVPSFLNEVADRIVTTDTFFELPNLPKRVGVLGLGAIGLELGLAMARLGVEVTGVDLANTVAGIQDPEISTLAREQFAKEFTLWLGEAAQIERTEQGVLIKSGERQTEVDLLLVALGRQPNLSELNLANAGFKINERGLPSFNSHTMQIDDLPVYIAGDINAERSLMHEAADEGAIAGYNACQTTPLEFHRKTPLAIAFSNPDIVTLGLGYQQLDPSEIIIGEARGSSNGRAKIIRGQHDLLRIYADKTTGKILGASMLGVNGEHLGHTLALAIHHQDSAESLLNMPFYHPTSEELLQTALRQIVRQLPNSSGFPMGLTPISRNGQTS